SVDSQRPPRARARREVAGDGVDAEPPDGEERREPGAVLGDQRSDRAFEPVLRAGTEEDAGGTETDEPEEDPTADRGTGVAVVHSLKGTERNRIWMGRPLGPPTPRTSAAGRRWRA